MIICSQMKITRKTSRSNIMSKEMINEGKCKTKRQLMKLFVCIIIAMVSI